MTDITASNDVNNKANTNRPVVPIFYSCDDRFVKYTIVSLKSMKHHASRDYEYRVCVLHTDISEKMQK